MKGACSRTIGQVEEARDELVRAADNMLLLENDHPLAEVLRQQGR